MNKPSLAYFGIKYFPSKGGVSRTTENLIRKLKNDFNITIYCYNNKKAKTNVQGINVIQIPRIPLGGVGVFIYFLLVYFHIMLCKNYDVLHVRKIDSSFFIPLFWVKYKNRILATSHESPYKRDKWNFLAKWYFKMNERLFIKSNARLTAISKPLVKYYKERYDKDVLYVPNGVDIETNLKHAEAKKIIQKFNIKEEYIIFGARRIMSTKGCHYMLKALNKINYSGSIIVVGDIHVPSYFKYLKELAKGLDVKYIGYIEKKILLALVKNALLSIFPSETEGMSIMLLESCSTGTPVISSDIPENTVIFDDNNMLFFKNKDAHDLAEKIKWATKNMDIMAKKAKSAEYRVMNEYSGKLMTETYKNLYLEIFRSQKK